MKKKIMETDKRERRSNTREAGGWIRRHKAAVVAALFLLLAGGIYLVAGDHAQIAVADNLDLFQAQYQMLKNTDSFRSADAAAPFLHGISRDVLPGECSLEAVLYQLLPSLPAYVVMYLVKVMLGTVSFTLLAGELRGRGLLGTQQAAGRGTVTAASSAVSFAAASPAASSVTVPPSAASSATAPPSAASSAATGYEEDGRQLAILAGLTYGCLNLFPSFGISFASIPLAVYLVLRLLRADSRRAAAGWLTAIFFYPWLSYFSYFGIFLVGYLVLALLLVLAARLIRGRNAARQDGQQSKQQAVQQGMRQVIQQDTRQSKRQVLQQDTQQSKRQVMQEPIRLLQATAVLAAGYVLWEHRLFARMLFGDEVSIRDTMVQTSLSFGEILQWIGKVLLNGVDLHCESAHRYVVLPVCLIYFVILNAGYLRRKDKSAPRHDLFNWGAGLLLFNSVVYGLYYCEGFRQLVEKLLPPLKGFQFSRTSFFNPFLWYGMFYLALYRLLQWGRRRSAGISNVPADVSALDGGNDRSRRRTVKRTAAAAWGLMLAAFLAVHLYGNTYNDLQHTAKAVAKELLGRESDNTLSYGEFYSVELFQKACEEIGYQGEWAAAYGFHPAVLEYNGIATIDGYLGFYSQSYKESFRRVIAPALEKNESSRIYYDEWGARCYLYSGSNPTIVEAVRSYPHAEDTLDVDPNALKELDCRYIFSRIRITNDKEKGLQLIGTFTEESSPYILYIYQV